MLGRENLGDVLGNLTKKRKKSIMTLSASKISTLWNCELEFLLRYVMREKPPKHVRLMFGSSIHRHLDKFYDVNYRTPESFAKAWARNWFREVSGESLKGKELENLVTTDYPTFKKRDGEEGFIKIGNHFTFGDYLEDGTTFVTDKGGRKKAHPKVNYSFSYWRLGTEMLKNFYTRHKGKEPPFIREGRYEPELFGHPTIVIFDRVDKWPTGEWSITDYKTSKWPPKKDELGRNFQFTLYSYAARQLFGKELGPKEKAVYHYHLRDSKLYATTRGDEDFNYLEKVLHDSSKKIDRILETGDAQFIYGYHCNFCEQKGSCKKYSASLGGPSLDEEDRIIAPITFEKWEDEEEKLAEIRQGKFKFRRKRA